MVPATWAAAMAVVALFALVLVRMRRRVPQLREEQLVRSPTHQAQVIALCDWLAEERIVRAILDSRVATLQGLQNTLRDVEGMSEGEVQATVGLLLRHRTVRLAVATWVQKARGIPKGPALKGLIEWAEPVKAEITA